MSKRLLSILCLLALLAGMAGVPSASAEGLSTLLVGYGKHDITPTTSTPMSGYGDEFNRMSEVDGSGKPVLIESNGDGVIDEKDGLFATCIAVTDARGRTLLLFSQDLINSADGLVTKLQRRVKERRGIEAAYVLLNSSHTHSGVAAATYFSYVTVGADSSQPFDGDRFNATYNRYPERQQAVEDLQVYIYDVLLAGLMAAAEEAMADRAEARMLIGSIEAPNMNFIRHYYNKIDSTDPADVYGSNTRGGGYYRKHYADANPNLYMIEFTRQDKAPIVAVDWRAHSTSVSTGTSNYGKDNRYRISPDYVGAFRYWLEQAGYLPSFFQGTAGNAVMDSGVNNDIVNYFLDPSNPTDKDVVGMWTYGTTTRASVIAPKYGKKLAAYALQGLQNNMHYVSGGPILAKRYYMYADRDTSENYKMIGGTDPKGNVLEGMLYERVPDEYDAEGNLMNVYTYLQTYYAYVTGWAGSSRGKTITAYLDKYGLNSVYHLGRVNSKFTNTMKKVTDKQGEVVLNANGDPVYEQKASIQGGFYLGAFAIGNSVGCVTAPFEIFDYPYTFRGERFPMTFVLGYTNGSNGYMPTDETYTFAGGRGAYEANNTAYAPGTADAIAARHQIMLDGLDRSALPAVCPACGETDVDWQSVEGVSKLTGGHYYLPSDINSTQRNVNADGGTVCLHLNGHSIINDNLSTSRVFAIQGGSTLNIMGDGLLQSQGVNPDNTYIYGGTILVNSNTTLNLYGGTVRYLLLDGEWIRQGGAIFAGGTVNMYGGRVEAVKASEDVAVTTESGGALYVGAKGTLNMTGGVLTGGWVTGEGDTLCAAAGATIRIGGTARIEGGAWLPAGVSLTLSGTPTINRGSRYGLYVAPDAQMIEAAGVEAGTEVWINTASVPQTFARVAADQQTGLFHYDGEGRIAYSTDGTLAADAPRDRGDLSGDGKVNGKDVVMLQRFVAGGYDGYAELSLADLNGDGKVNGKDVVMMQRFVAGGYDVSL